MKATLTIITMPVSAMDRIPTTKRPTDNQIILEQLPAIVRRIDSGLANASDAEWIDHTVSGLIDRLRKAKRQTDHLEMTLCHAALQYSPPRRINQTGQDITPFPTKWTKSDAWTIPGIGNA